MAFAVSLLRDQEGHGMAGAKKAEQRIYRTVDGELVAEGDPGARFLAYPVGDPIKPAEVEAYDALIAGDDDGDEYEVVLEDDDQGDGDQGDGEVVEFSPEAAEAVRARGALPDVPGDMYAPDAEPLPDEGDAVQESDVDGDRELVDQANAKAADDKPAVKKSATPANKARRQPANK